VAATPEHRADDATRPMMARVRAHARRLQDRGRQGRLAALTNRVWTSSATRQFVVIILALLIAGALAAYGSLINPVPINQG
jgi:hypothetical protein